MPANTQPPRPRPHGAPAHYLGRPASWWVTAFHQRRGLRLMGPARQAVPAPPGPGPDIPRVRSQDQTAGRGLLARAVAAAAASPLRKPRPAAGGPHASSYRHLAMGWAGRAVLIGGLLGGTGALGGLVAPSAFAGPTSVSFTTAGCTTWPVPAGVTTVNIQATGAAGGTGANGEPGGTGDGVSAALSGLPSGQVLDVCVNSGGGNGGSAPNVGGGGGGASGVSLGSDFSAPVLVAAGGGGGGGNGSPEAGGNAGFPDGSPGNSAFNPAAVGGGGTQTMGGAGGVGDASTGNGGMGFTASGPGNGGAGGNAPGSGGGGGAGYYGGGGAGGGGSNFTGGGGGGSDFCTDTSAVTDCAFSAGAGTGTGAGSAPGDAMVTITHAVPATTWTVKPGGTITAALAAKDAATIADAATGATVASCSTSSSNDSLKSGSGRPGRGIGSVTAFALSNCSPNTGFTGSGFPWHLNALSYNATTGVTSGRMTGVHVSYSVPATSAICSGVLDGTGDTANNGMIPFIYNNATHRLRFVKGGNLHVYDNTCPNMTNGGKLAFTGSYTLSPTQTITSP